jgi:hypothetical protein
VAAVLEVSNDETLSRSMGAIKGGQTARGFQMSAVLQLWFQSSTIGKRAIHWSNGLTHQDEEAGRNGLYLDPREEAPA